MTDGADKVTTISKSPRPKRIVICFDGTWNKLSADTPTNVVLTAASVQRTTADGTVQIIHYDEGVGTGVRDRLTGGMFGAGLATNLREAYRFLLFNYDPGDHIHVFGFSRGAFTARTFVGLLRHVGPLRRIHVDRIDEAIGLYQLRLKGKDGSAEAMRRFRADFANGVCVGQADEDWRCANVEGYAPCSAPRFSVRFLGIWDTVAAMGVPEVIPGSSFWNRDHRYHDTSIDGFVESMRHAVAIDERRALFPLTSVGDLAELNAASGHAPDDPKAPYQEMWFPGVHGSVGGGGDIRGLSDGALAWVLDGAKKAGLRLDTARGTRINSFEPDPLAPLLNIADPKPSMMDALKTDRHGPDHAWQVSMAATRRWHAEPALMPRDGSYRPKPLARVAAELNATELPKPQPFVTLETIIVENGDTLTGLARRFYGRGSLWHAILAANPSIDDPDTLFSGQKLTIPKLPDAASEEGLDDAAA